MILTVNFEELQALRSGADAYLTEAETLEAPVAAPPEERALVEALIPFLEGDLSISTLEEQRDIEAAVSSIVTGLLVQIEAGIVATHPAHEHAVAAYFDFAHARSVLERIRDVGEHMEALIEVVTGSEPSDEAVSSFVFPD